ncbi:MAG: caspase family protein [Thermodesulfobacteriota bacterium]
MRSSGFVVAAVLAWVVMGPSLPNLSGAGGRALLIGVEQYQDPKHNLDGVADDVRLMKEVLIEKGLFTGNEIRTLLDRDATKSNVVRQLKEWLISGTKPGDRALFYFSGHGIQVWDENGDEIQDCMDEALMCHDSNVRANKVKGTCRGRHGHAWKLKDTANVLLDDELGELLAKLEGRTVIFISDSCHSGSVYKSVNADVAVTKNWEIPSLGKGVFDDREAAPAPEEKAVVRERTSLGADLTPRGVKMAAFTASEDSQPAQVVIFGDEPRGKHSVYTWHIYNGLKGKADLGGDGNITFAKLAKYVGDEIKRRGYAQVPQFESHPEALEKEAILVAKTRTTQPAERPKRIACYLDGQRGLMSAEVTRMKSAVSAGMPVLQWTDDKSKATLFVWVEKVSEGYVGQMTDSTGAVWEKHRGPTLDDMLKGLSGNMRAYYVQTAVSALRNKPNRMDFELQCLVKGKAPRAAGQAVKDDAVAFITKPGSSGHLLVFSVDALGVIHPLYPLPNQPVGKVSPGRAVVLGENGAFTVQAPFGRDIICAIMSSEPVPALGAFWAKDDVGHRDRLDSQEQDRLLDALWAAFNPGGSQKTDWASQVLFLTSFERGGGS